MTRPDLGAQLGHLRTFIQVARAKSLADAGRALYRSPAAVSRAMGELEQVLGGALFDRTSRGVRLNDRGRTVLARAQRIDQELTRAAAELGAVPGPLYDGKRLLVITSLVDRGTVSLAADALSMTQSGVSMALSRAEAALGAQLFTRSPHGLAVRPETGRMAVHAKRAFAELRYLSSDLASAGGQVAGAVSIGSLPLGRTQVVPAAIDAALSLHPALRVTTVESHYEQLTEGLRSGEVDVVIGVPRGGDPGLRTESLFDDRLAVLARAGHPLQSFAPVALADVAPARWILPRAPSPSRRLLVAAFERAGLIPPVPVVESADLAIVRHLLLADDVLALASARQFTVELNAGLIKELPVTLPGMSRPVALILRAGSTPSPAVQAIVDALRHQAAEVLTGDGALRGGDEVVTFDPPEVNVESGDAGPRSVIPSAR